jgi:hypothetical protein
MREFIKKALIGTVFLLLFIAIFWKTLTATAFWGLAVYQTKDHSATKLTPGPMLALQIATSSASSTVYGSLNIPHFFTQTDVLLPPGGRQTVFSDLDSNAYYLITNMESHKDGFIGRQADKTAAEITTFCNVLTNVFTINPCQDDRSFITTVMMTSRSTAGLFSNHQTKNAAATFLLLKTAYVPEGTTNINPFTTNDISGHLTYASADSIAYLFDTNETGYEIVFVNMDQTEIESILASISSYE